MMEFATALKKAKSEATDRFPDGSYTLKTHQWNDGDFRITVSYGFGATEGETQLREDIIITPHRSVVQVVEITQSERTRVHKTVEL